MSSGMKRKWWEGPWVFVVGGCCLGCLILPIACVALVGTGGFWAISRNPVTQLALEAANESTQLETELGAPIEFRWFSSETQMEFNNSGAEISVKISGPKATGHLSGNAEKIEDEWVFERLEARLEDGRVIDLLTDREVSDEQEYEQLSLDATAEATSTSAEAAVPD